MSDRRRLPNRRPIDTTKLSVGGQTYFISLGIDPTAADVREVFLAGPRDGSQLGALAQDAAVLISIALQHGLSAEALSKSVARLPDGEPASIIGATLDLVRQAGGGQ